jgi:hypothetical protein
LGITVGDFKRKRAEKGGSAKSGKRTADMRFTLDFIGFFGEF